jgi:hypothetical protein
MTSNEIVTQLRRRLNKLNPTAAFQDAEIWREFTFARSRVYKNQLSRRKKIPRLAYHKICMELINAPANECCTDVCTIKKSVHQIPSYLYTSNNATLKVTNMKNKPLPSAPSECIEDNIKYMPGYKDQQVWDVVNGHLVMFNSSATSFQVEAIWANPLDLLFIQKCDQSNCIQDSKELIQIDEVALLDMFNIVMQSLSPSIQIPVDETGDNSENS